MKKFLKAVGISTLCLASSCGGGNNDHLSKLRATMQNNDWVGAVEYVKTNQEKMYSLSEKDQKNKLLYLLDKSYLNQHAGNHQDADKGYQEAIQTIDDLWTKSISKEIGAAMVGENVLDYGGTDYEKVLAHIYAAINYASMGDLENARVEARRVSDRLEQYNAQYDTPNTYKDDAFARWFSGWLLESEGGEQATNDAKIDYETSAKIFSSTEYADIYKATTPKFVVEDLLRSASYVGILDTVSTVAEQNKEVTYPSKSEYVKKGQILFIHQVGEAPVKTEAVEETTVGQEITEAILAKATPDEKTQKVLTQVGLSLNDLFSQMISCIGKVTYALPQLAEKSFNITDSTMTVNGVSAETVMVEDINALAKKAFNDDLPRIKRRAITRTIIKNSLAGASAFATQLASSKAGGPVPVPAPTEATFRKAYETADKSYFNADTRSWFTLPGALRASRMYLEPGKYDITINYKNANGETVGSKTFNGITVKAGSHIVLTDRTI